MNSFRIEASELQGWHAAVAQRIDLRGVAAVAKEIEAHLARQEADGTVVVTRHQLFTWAEALHGASLRDPRAAAAGAQLSLPQVVADMRGILTGKPVAPAAPAHAPRVVDPPYGGTRDATGARTEPVREPQGAPPAVTYVPAPVPSMAPGAVRVVMGPDVGATVRDLIRSTTQELCVSAPWQTGIETLVADVVALDPAVRVNIVSRRPQPEDAAFHQALDQLGRRRAVTAFSNLIQTRMVIQDETRALVGAASVPNAALSREVGLLVVDPNTVRALKAQFLRAHDEAAGVRRY